MGNSVDAVSDAVSDIGGFIKDGINEGIDIVADTTKDAYNIVYKYTGQEWVESHVLGSNFSRNVFNGVVDNIANLSHGITNGDWTQIRDSGLGLVTTAIAVIAIISMNPWLMAAGFIILDAQYNQGQVLGDTISVAADIEEATINTHYIETYAAEIQILITVASTIAAGQYSMPIIGKELGIAATIANWTVQLDYIAAGYGGYQTYMAIQAIRDSQEYWKEKLREAEAYYRKLIAQANAAKNLWFDMMTNPDMINRIQAGGDLFLLGAGHDLFSITSVAEPRFALGLIDTSDSEMDKLMNNRYFAQSAGSDGFRVN